MQSLRREAHGGFPSCFQTACGKEALGQRKGRSHGRFTRAARTGGPNGGTANNPRERHREQLVDQHHCKEHMANDKTKPTEEDIAPKHAKAPSAQASGTGDDSRKKRPQIAALIVLLVVLVCAAIAGGAYLVWQNAQIAKSAEEAAATPEPEAPTTSQDAADPRVENPIDFASLRLENPDIYAWIYIPGTDVNYPVVQHPTDDTFYLKHNKDGEWSEEGAIYTQLANRTDFSDPVTVIYGHNLVQGTMFTTLHRFENKDFFDSHEDMYVYTDGHILTYRVIAAYQYDNRHILNSFNFSDPTIVQQYFESVLSPDSLVENVREGTTLTSSDKIVQLSTCTGDSNHIVRRYLVTGVLVSDQPTY